jgi:hypothetical protein
MSTVNFAVQAGVEYGSQDVVLDTSTFAANFLDVGGVSTIGGTNAGCAYTGTAPAPLVTDAGCQWTTTVPGGSPQTVAGLYPLLAGGYAIETLSSATQSITLLISAAAGAVAGSGSITFTDATNSFNATTPFVLTTDDTWTVLCSTNNIEIQLLKPDPEVAKVLWLQITLDLNTGVTLTPSTLAAAPWGVVALMPSDSSTPPLPCFGAETVVLMADGSRQQVRSLVTGAQVAAVAQDGSVHADTVDVLVRRHLQDPKAISGCRPALHTLAPGVRVTGEHLMLVRRGSAVADGLVKAHAQCSCGGALEQACDACAAAPVCVDGFAPFLARDSTVQPTTGLFGDKTSVYHLALRAHPDWALVVGGDVEDAPADGVPVLAVGDMLAEGYRSAAAASVEDGTFVLVE